jgi:hypothetical protein
MVGQCVGVGTVGRCDVDLLTDGANWIWDELARPLLLPGRPRSFLLSAPRSNMNRNALNGTVPTEIGRLTGLTQL